MFNWEGAYIRINTVGMLLCLSKNEEMEPQNKKRDIMLCVNLIPD